MRNLTFFSPSKDDLILLLPRVSERAKAFAYYYGLDDLYSRIRGPGGIIAEPTLSGALNASKSNATKAFTQAVTPTSAVETVSFSAFEVFSINNFKMLASVLSYVSSKWAITTLGMTIILNRTHFYASSRVPLNLRWPVRLALYLIPIVSLSYQVLWLLQGLRCQSSPEWAQHRYGNANKRFKLDYAGEGGFLYQASSALLFWESEERSCMNVNMSHSQARVGSNSSLNGSLSLLWPLFTSFCLSQFVETLAATLQGGRPVGDLNLVEFSLAFAEAESMVLKPFDLAFSTAASEVALNSDTTKFKRKDLLQAMNVAPEMLLISLLWALNNLTSNVMAVFRIRHKYRLVNTGFWGMTYLLAFSWSIIRLWPGSDAVNDSWLFRFPTVFVVGFCPHILVLLGMAVCGVIYAAALILTALSLPPGPAESRSLKEKVRSAYRNLQANVHFSNTTPLTFNLSDDFYTTLLTTGFAILTAASEAVYLNESAKVRISNLTWLERKRIQELQQGLLFKKTRAAIPSELRAAIHDRNEAIAGSPPPSGYALERKAQTSEKDAVLAAVRGESAGVGFLQRGGRWQMAFRLMQGTAWLILGFYAKTVLFALEKMGVRRRPEWLCRFVGDVVRKGDEIAPDQAPNSDRLDFWMLSDDGKLCRATDRSVDVEAEMRRRQGMARVPDENMDDTLYGWWKQGGWWGDVDNNGDYEPRPQEDDLTSMVSFSTETTSLDDGGQTEIEEGGRRTPTQSNPWPGSREGTPDDVLDADRLASLLDPKSAEDQQDARMLSRRLRKQEVMTRSQYQRALQQERAAVIASSRYAPSLSLDSLGSPVSAEYEEMALAQLLISSRTAKGPIPQDDGTAGTWSNGAEGMGSNGPQCVVCQDSPRTILLWPCGCLCLCDDCRVNMATRNFSSCICCRTTTVAYSRLYVP